MVLPNYGVYTDTLLWSLWCYPTKEFMVLPNYGVYAVTLLWSVWCYPTMEFMELPYYGVYGVTPPEFMICNYIPPAGANFSHKLVYNFLTGNIPREGTQASTSLLLLLL